MLFDVVRIFYFGQSVLLSHALPLLPPIIPVNSTDGRAMLMEALNLGTAVHYINLATHHQAQETGSYCSAATTATIMNSFSGDGAPAPTTYEHTPNAYHKQWSVLSGECARRVHTHNGEQFGPGFASTNGVTFDEMISFAHCWADVEATRASASTVAGFREAVASATSRQVRLGRNVTSVVAFNFNRPALAQEGEGHWSHIGAYHEERDMVLVMDVAKYKYPPFWVPVELAYASANTVDHTSGETRGWAVLTPAPRQMPPENFDIYDRPELLGEILSCRRAAGDDINLIRACSNTSRYDNEPRQGSDSSALLFVGVLSAVGGLLIGASGAFLAMRKRSSLSEWEESAQGSFAPTQTRQIRIGTA